MSRNTFHVEFAESLGLCLFCHCAGDDTDQLIGVWCDEHGVFEGDDSRTDLPCSLEAPCKCELCGFQFYPTWSAVRSIAFAFDCDESEPSWVGFDEQGVVVHVRTDENARTIHGLLAWSRH